MSRPCESCGRQPTDDQVGGGERWFVIHVEDRFAFVCPECFDEIDPDMWVEERQWNSPGRFRKLDQLERRSP